MTAPRHRDAFQYAYAHVRGDADECVNDDAHHESRDLEQAVGLGHQIPDALAGTDALGEDEGDDRDPGGEAQPCHDRRHRQGHHDPADQLPTIDPEAARRLDHTAVDVPYAVEGVQVHGEQRGQGNEVDVGGLADAEPDD